MNKFVAVVALLIAGFAASLPAWAQSFPSKPARIIVGITPGSPPDVLSRLVGADMEKRLGQPFVVENRPGANSTIAAKAVANAAPDGYTLFFGSATNISSVFVKNNSVDATKEFAAISNLFTSPYTFFVSAKQPFKTWQDVVAYAKANPGKLNFGTASQLAALLMNVLGNRSGITYATISYKGGPENAQAIVSGEVDVTITVPVVLTTAVQAGTARALFNTRPFWALPSVPTAAEAGIANYDVVATQGMWGPSGIPKDVVQRLNMAAVAATKTPGMSEQSRKAFGGDVLGSTPEEQMRTYESDIRFWREAARISNFQPE